MTTGNKVTTVALAMMLFCILLQTNLSDAATYPAGGATGWGFTMKGWPNGKTFKAGDVIEFKYQVGLHNVVKVSKAAYDSCNGSGGGQVFSSGDDKITLAKGTSYYICTIGPHCTNGVRAAIIAN